MFSYLKSLTSFLIISVFLLLSGFAAHADYNPITLTNEESGHNLDHHMHLLVDETNQLTINQVSRTDFQQHFTEA
jgi:hypothetical protein